MGGERGRGRERERDTESKREREGGDRERGGESKHKLIEIVLLSKLKPFQTPAPHCSCRKRKQSTAGHAS